MRDRPVSRSLIGHSKLGIDHRGGQALSTFTQTLKMHEMVTYACSRPSMQVQERSIPDLSSAYVPKTSSSSLRPLDEMHKLYGCLLWLRYGVSIAQATESEQVPHLLLLGIQIWS